MAAIDLTKYGITGVTEIIYNPSNEVLYEEEMKPELTGFDKCQPGVWNKMPLESKDHLAFMGCGEDYEMYGAFMLSVALRMLNLPTVDADDVTE